MLPKICLLALVVVLAVAQIGCGGYANTEASSSVPVTPAQTIQEFESRLEGLRNLHKIPGMSVLIVRDQKVVWSHGFGMFDIPAQTSPSPTHSFHLASLTKTFASAIIMQLVQEGKLDLDAQVSNFGINLPGVKVRHLLTHTSEGVPGSTFKYNGDRYELLTVVISQAANKSFGQLVSERIIAPLALKQTAPNPKNAEFAFTGFDLQLFEANLARPYVVNSSGAFTPSSYPANFGAAAGLVSSAADMALYSNALDQNELVSAQSKTQMFTNQLTNSGAQIPYGLGWFVQQRNGNKVIWHYGFWTANSSLIIKIPERGLMFVALANGDGLSHDFDLGSGDVTVSPFAREFLSAFASGNPPLL
jgi:CubicO group peptidase (beta-lactamase class C family)